MTKQEIIEGNTLIAEFAGYIYFPESENSPEHWHANKDTVKLKGHVNLSGFSIYRLEFHESWDWLIPVCHQVAKINSTEIEKNNILSMPNWEFGSLGLESNIQSVWLAVVKFIKWYNNQKENK